jgi:hypothetical protein
MAEDVRAGGPCLAALEPHMPRSWMLAPLLLLLPARRAERLRANAARARPHRFALPPGVEARGSGQLSLQDYPVRRCSASCGPIRPTVCNRDHRNRPSRTGAGRPVRRRRLVANPPCRPAARCGDDRLPLRRDAVPDSREPREPSVSPFCAGFSSVRKCIRGRHEHNRSWSFRRTPRDCPDDRAPSIQGRIAVLVARRPDVGGMEPTDLLDARD